MATIDERVVEMKFNNGQFKSGATETVGLLDKLKSALKLDGAAKGLSQVDAAAKNVNLGVMAKGIESIQQKFSTMSIVAITALTNITNKAVNAGIQVARALTITPIMDGFREYELKMGSIQTILANTSRHGTTLDDVSKSLDDLNEYADKTIYNFGEMTKNIGLFTNAGLKLEESTSMIKGFSNVAAASGTTASGAAGAAYQLSQALSAGTIRLMDWRSLTTVGMGNKNMQNDIVTIAEAMGALEGSGTDAKTIMDDFGASLEKKWLSADVMSKYLQIMAGDLSKAEQAQLGLTDAQIKGLAQTQKTAQEAAQKTRTFTQMYGQMQEVVGSGWGETFGLIIGDFDEATELWSAVNDTLGGLLERTGKARNAMLKEWVDLGGRDLAITAMVDAWKALVSVLKPVGEAFSEIFPAMTGKDLYTFTAALAEVAKSLILGKDAAEDLKRTFRGVFAVLDIGWMVIKGLAGVIFDLVGVVFEGTGGFLEFTGGIGDWLVSVRDAIKNGEGLTKFFDGLSKVLQYPIQGIKNLAKFLGNLMTTDVDIAGKLTPIESIGKVISKLWGGLLDIFKAVWKAVQPFASMMGDFFGDFGVALGEAFSSMDFSTVLDMINTGLFAGLVLLIKNFLGGGWLDQIKEAFSFGGGDDEGGGFLDGIKEALGGLTDTLSTMQNTLKATTLILIAGAIALMAASVKTLSEISPEDLGKAVGAIAAMMTELGLAMLLFTTFSKGFGFVKMPMIAGSLILLAIAVNILADAAEKMGEQDWDEIAKGLTGTAGLLAALGLYNKFGAVSKGGIANAAGLILLATAVNILGKAVEKFGEMEWGEIGRGLTTLAGVLGILAIFSAVTGKTGGMVASGAGLLIMSAALGVLTGVLERMSKFSWEEIGKSMVTLAGSLAILAGAMYLMTGALPGAAALIVAATALRILTPSLEAMGELGWEEIGKIMVTLAGGLLILAGGLTAMIVALPGAAALVVASFALGLFVPVLKSLGEMSWGTIFTGLTALAAALTLLGIAGVLLLPAIPGLLGLGVALTLLGVAIALAGVGVLAFSIGFAALVAAVSGGTVLLVEAVKSILGLIPYAMEQIGLGLVALIEALAANTEALIAAFVAIGLAILDAINQLAPEIVATLLNLIWLLINTLEENVPKFVDSGAKIIIGFLEGLGSNMQGIIDAGTEVVLEFLQGIQNNQQEVADEGADTVIGFVNSVAATIETKSGEMQAAGGRLALAIADGMSFGLASKVGELGAQAANLANSVIGRAKAALGINSPSRVFTEIGEFTGEGFSIGMDNSTGMVGRSADGLGKSAIGSMRSAISGLNTLVSDEMDAKPTITPVLDLSGVRKDAGLIAGMMGGKAGLSYDQADDISDTMRRESEETEGLSQSGAVIFNQNNYSPKALSDIEIYRQTRNQLSEAKEALNK